jgi:hypothetical protein
LGSGAIDLPQFLQAFDPMENLVSTLVNPAGKVIGPRAHAVADYSTVATLLGIGMRLRNQHPRASTFAFVNAAAVLMSSLLTDYPGGLFKRISFKTHGAIDVAQAALLAAGPAVLGFARDAEAQLFYAQAALEAGVVAATDWDAPVETGAAW